MNFAKASLLNGVAVVTKVGTALLLNKLLAVIVGPSGYAVIGQFQNVVAVTSTLAGGALGNGVIKLTVEARDDPERRDAAWRSAVTLGLAGGLVTALVVAVAHRTLARWTFGDAAHASVFLWLAVSLTLIVMNGVFMAILNGLKALRAYVLASIGGSLLSAALAVFLVLRFDLYGALVAVAAGQAAALLATLVIFDRLRPLPWSALLGRIDRKVARSLGSFALMAVVTAIALPCAQLVIRGEIVRSNGLESAGLWQAMTKFSEFHLMLLTMTMSVYLLPQLAGIRDAATLRREIGRAMRFVLPVVLVTAGLLYAFRAPFIRTLLSREFLPVGDALGIQLVGDVFKMGSWVLAYTMISHGRTQLYIATEIGFAALLAGLTVALSAIWNLRGAAGAYALTYALYWFAMFLAYRSLLGQLGEGTAAVQAGDATAP